MRAADIRALLGFLWENRNWALIPVILLLLLLAAIILLSSTDLAPFMYTLF